jgi:heme exporter protein D
MSYSSFAKSMYAATVLPLLNLILITVRKP